MSGLSVSEPKHTGDKFQAVSMKGIVKRFGTNVALNGVDLTVHSGEIHALLGENGAGKSTLMHVLSGLLRSDAGEISLNGRSVTLTSPAQARKAGIAMVHQHFTLVPAFTVAENLALDRPASWFESYSPMVAATLALERAATLGWELPADMPVSELSVGVQQRIEIVKALSSGAQILIFDEPTAVLAGDEVEELFTVLRRLRDEGCAVILIAHKLSEILAVADTVTVLRRGTLVSTASVSDVTAPILAQWMVGDSAKSALLAPSQSVGSNSHDLEPGKNEPVVLTLENISLLGDRGETVLRDLSFSVSAGRIFGIGGVDGNGQTELAELLVGLRKSFTGTIRWKESKFVPGDSPSTGYLPQDRRRVGLATTMSVEENLIFDAVSESEFRVGGLLRRGALHKLAQDLVEKFDIRTASSQSPALSLSGGNQQKIVAARVFRVHRDLVVAMNPSRGLDIGATRFVHDRLLEARAQGSAVVLISTDLDELALLSDETAILGGGTLTPFRINEASATDLGLLLGGSKLGVGEGKFSPIERD